MNTPIAYWTLDELQVAITTMEHDLRGSWNGGYASRMACLCELCEAVITECNSKSEKEKFKEKLKGKHKFYEMAMHDLIVAKDEMQDPCDGRVFRDAARFYDLELSEKGKTDRVIDWLKWNCECDDYHWFDRESE